MAGLEQIHGAKTITCVDAGAAGGLNELSRLRKFISLFSFEPLQEEYSALRNNQSLLNQFNKHKIFPLALHSHTGRAALHISNRPSMSSLLEFDEKTFDKHF